MEHNAIKQAKGKPTPRWIFAPFLVACGLIAVLATLQWADKTYPVDFSKLEQRSFVVVDRNGQLLRAFATTDGRWRLPVSYKDVDPRYLKMLIAYEDKRFYSHFGIDVFATMRAGYQMLRHGRIVSGGSTITMQVARLLEGPTKRSFSVKLRQMARAIQIERRLSKEQILDAYLLLAPYGGNLEGVRAASLAYFGQEPKVLNTAQAAMLVALPQSPETRRPDRQFKRALAARNRIIERSVDDGIIEKFDGLRAKKTVLVNQRRALPSLAAHLSFQARVANAASGRVQLTVDKAIQTNIENLVREKLVDMTKEESIAVLVANHQTGEIIAHVASPDFFDKARLGEVDMISALRSPGSTLKPFIYGLAFEAGIVHPQSLIDDVRQSFSGYRPRNFDLAYQGTVTVERALQQSLNIPAISLLSSVGPDKLLARFRRADVKVKLPRHKSVGLAIGLGGLGISLSDLVQLYSMIPRGGIAVVLQDGVRDIERGEAQRSLSHVASWYLQDILSRVSVPDGAAGSRNIGYKTGTSYGYRDAWSVGFDGKYVIGVWVGRPDGVPVPRITGRSVAAPILFEAFGRISSEPVELPKPAQGAMRLRTAQLPKVLQRFVPRGDLVQHNAKLGKTPTIAYPPDGAKVDIGLLDQTDNDEVMPLFLKVEGGVAPFKWLANGKPIMGKSLRRRIEWMPDSVGYSQITVLDAVGRAAQVRVFVK